MATYTININERTKEGRSIVDYLREKGLIPVPQTDNGKEFTNSESDKKTLFEVKLEEKGIEYGTTRPYSP